MQPPTPAQVDCVVRWANRIFSVEHLVGLAITIEGNGEACAVLPQALSELAIAARTPLRLGGGVTAVQRPTGQLANDVGLRSDLGILRALSTGYLIPNNLAIAPEGMGP